MRRYYSVFDYKNERLGLANAKPSDPSRASEHHMGTPPQAPQEPSADTPGQRR